MHNIEILKHHNYTINRITNVLGFSPAEILRLKSNKFVRFTHKLFRTLTELIF